MILCVDIGNTSIKMARAGARGVGRVHVVPVQAGARELGRVVRLAAGTGVGHAAIASVRPSSTGPVRRALQRELGVTPFVITHRAEWPLEIATRRPDRVGVDRLCAACGALGPAGQRAIVVDAGTAITVDLVVGRRFLGGLILAGPQTGLSALHRVAAQLPDLCVPDGAGRFDDTAPAMQTGALVGAAGAIEASVRWLRAKAGAVPPVWLTGGHAPRLWPLLPSGWRHDPHLTLRGIAVVARLNLD